MGAAVSSRLHGRHPCQPRLRLRSGHGRGVPDRDPGGAAARCRSRAAVDPAWLPPVGTQTTPSSVAWAVIYGLATHKAARAARRAPTEPALQASPHYPYIKILEQTGGRPGLCRGGLISWCFDFLLANDGAPTLDQAPAPVPKPGHSPCQAAWRAYGGTLLVSDYAFSIAGCGQVDITSARPGLTRCAPSIAARRAAGLRPLAPCRFPDLRPRRPGALCRRRPDPDPGRRLPRRPLPAGRGLRRRPRRRAAAQQLRPRLGHRMGRQRRPHVDGLSRASRPWPRAAPSSSTRAERQQPHHQTHQGVRPWPTTPSPSTGPRPARSAPASSPSSTTSPSSTPPTR